MKKLTLWAMCATAMMAGTVYGANAMNKKSSTDGYDLRALVEPITFSCELRDVRLTRVIDRMSSGESSVTREINASSGRRTDSAGRNLSVESKTDDSSSNRNEDSHRSGTKFDVGGGLKWGLIPSVKVGGEYSNGAFDERRRFTDETVSTKRGDSATNSTVDERIDSESQDTTSEITNESRLGSYKLVFSVSLRNMDATDRLKVDGEHMRAQLSGGELPGTVIAQYKERGVFWLGAEETICGFTYSVEDAKMLKALQRLDRDGKLGQLKLSQSGADIVVTSEKTGRNVLSDLNAANAHHHGTRFSVEFGELMTLPDWSVSCRHSAKSGPRGKRVSIHEALLAIQCVAVDKSEALPCEIFSFANDGSLTNVVDRPLIDKDSEGRYRMFALRLTKNNGAKELCLPNAEIMKAEIANYTNVALFSFGLEEFVNVSFENPEYFSKLKNEVEKYLGSGIDKMAFNVYRGLVETRIRKECDSLPEDITTITADELKICIAHAKAGVPEMQAKLAIILFMFAKETEDEFEKEKLNRAAMKWINTAAENGNAEAQLGLANRYYVGDGVKQDKVQAMKWLRKAAEQGNAEAQHLLGNLYFMGVDVAQDLTEAEKWIRKAATQGNALAKQTLDDINSARDLSEEEHKLSKAIEQLRKKAAKGDAKAQRTLDEIAEINKKHSVGQLRKRAEEGDVDAQVELGMKYANGEVFGEGLRQDMTEAVKWLRKAAERGNAEAQCMLGVFYAGGIGVEANVTEAMKWLRKAAEQGNPQAQFALGIVYLEGQGVPVDEAEAKAWILKAAKQGYAPAQSALDEFEY